MKTNILIYLTPLFLLGCRTIAPLQKTEAIVSEKVLTKEGQIAHVATVDLRRARLAIILPTKRNKLSKVTKQARMAKADIAINAGFFGADGSVVGPLKIDGRWLSKPNPNKMRGAMGFDSKHGIVFDRLSRVGQTIIQGKQAFAEPGWWDDFDNVLGGIPLLLREGKIIDPSEEQTQSAFLTERYARTAFCRCSDEIVKFVVIEGGDNKTNLISEARGMSIAELSNFLLSLGCRDALNLDGGYSSSYVWQGHRINKFSLARPERKVSSVLIASTID